MKVQHILIHSVAFFALFSSLLEVHAQFTHDAVSLMPQQYSYVISGSPYVAMDSELLNALFTSRFKREFAEKLEKEFQDTLEESQVDILSTSLIAIHFSGGGGFGSSLEDGRLTQLTVNFPVSDNLTTELVKKLSPRSGPLVMEMVKQRIDKLSSSLVHRRLQQLDELEARLSNNLKTVSDQLKTQREALTDYKVKTLEGAEVLKSNVLLLKQMEREAKLELLELESRREAIEKRLEQLNASSEDAAASALRKELETIVAQRQKSVEAVERASTQGIAAARAQLATASEHLAQMRQLHEKGIASKQELLKQEAQLEEARASLEAAEAARKLKVQDQMAKVAEARLTLLREMDQRKLGPADGRYQKLNEMLTEVVIEIDKIHGMQSPLQQQIEVARQDYTKRLYAEAQGLEIQRYIAELERDQKELRARLRKLQEDRSRIPSGELRIVEWGG